MTTTLPLPQTIQNPAVTIVPADTTTLKTFCTAGAAGTLLGMVNVASSDTASRVVQIYLSKGGTDYPVSAVTIPAASGTDGTAASVDLINSTMIPGLTINANGKRFWQLAIGSVVKVAVLTTVTAAKQLTFTGAGEDL